MDYLAGKCMKIKEFIFKRKLGLPKKRKISRFEMYSEHIYNVLAWKDIGLTLKVFLFVNFMFWVFVSWHIKIYGVIFATMLVCFLGDSYLEKKHPNGFVTYYSEDYNEFCNASYDLWQSLIKYRQDNHFSFCFCNCIIFFICYVASRSIPDYVLLYLAILGLFFVPLAFLCLPEEITESIKQAFLRLGTQAVMAEEELMPFLSHRNFESQDDLDSLLTDKTQDSLTSSLASGIATMPSYLDVDNDSKSPSFTPTKGLTDTDSDDSDSENKEIYFHSKHFNGSSSSEEEFAKGLQPSQGFSGLFTQLGSTLVANIMTQSAPPPRLETQTSSSESEFEMINEDDMSDDIGKST